MIDLRFKSHLNIHWRRVEKGCNLSQVAFLVNIIQQKDAKLSFLVKECFIDLKNILQEQKYKNLHEYQ